MNVNHWVSAYLEAYVSGVTALPSPDKQIFFLAADVHPNVAAAEFTSAGKSLPLHSKWLRPSITELISRLKGLSEV